TEPDDDVAAADRELAQVRTDLGDDRAVVTGDEGELTSRERRCCGHAARLAGGGGWVPLAPTWWPVGGSVRGGPGRTSAGRRSRGGKRRVRAVSAACGRAVRRSRRPARTTGCADSYLCAELVACTVRVRHTGTSSHGRAWC